MVCSVIVITAIGSREVGVSCTGCRVLGWVAVRSLRERLELNYCFLLGVKERAIYCRKDTTISPAANSGVCVWLEMKWYTGFLCSCMSLLVPLPPAKVRLLLYRLS